MEGYSSTRRSRGVALARKRNSILLGALIVLLSLCTLITGLRLTKPAEIKTETEASLAEEALPISLELGEVTKLNPLVTASLENQTNQGADQPAPLGATIYLTFDDGPGAYTAELLDILKKYNVKATFFVTGAGSDDLLQREYAEGHSIGLHTFSHNYSYVYSSLDNFFADLYKVQDRVKNATGYTSYLMRFPGGSSNLVSANYDGGTRIMSRLVQEVEARGFTYFDWNISSGDAGGTTSTSGVYSNVINAIGPGGTYVVLQHDVKDFSVAAVESIIQYGLSRGCTFDKLDASSFSAHHGVSN